MSDTTSVDQTNPEAKTEGAVAGNETDELDALLDQFDQENSGQEQTQQTETQQADNSDIAAQVQKLVKAQEAQEAKAQAADTQQGIQEAVGWGMEVLKEKEISVPDGTEKLFEGFLDTAARDDRRIAQAFLNRHAKPAAWKKVVVAKAGDFSKFFQTSASTNQREKISAAVAQSRTETQKGSDFPSAEELGSMSDREFRKLWRGMTGGM